MFEGLLGDYKALAVKTDEPISHQLLTKESEIVSKIDEQLKTFHLKDPNLQMIINL